MTNEDQMVADLLDKDGSCRDMNFEDPTWEGIVETLALISAQFQSFTAQNDSGEELPDLGRVKSQLPLNPNQSLSLNFKDGSSLINQLQIYIFAESTGNPFIELTFFPDDIDSAQLAAATFLDWADSLRDTLGAKRYFVRYENASWKFGDTGPQSGVIYTSE